MTYREHALYHQRTLDQQILDALLRIEEILKPAPTPVAKVEPQAEEPAKPAPKKKKW